MGVFLVHTGPHAVVAAADPPDPLLPATPGQATRTHPCVLL
jgi:hypothetical protein